MDNEPGEFQWIGALSERPFQHASLKAGSDAKLDKMQGNAKKQEKGEKMQRRGEEKTKKR